MAINPYFYRGISRSILKEIYDYRQFLKRPEEIEGIFTIQTPSTGFENKNSEDNKEEEKSENASSSNVHVSHPVEPTTGGDGHGPHGRTPPDHLEDCKE